MLLPEALRPEHHRLRAVFHAAPATRPMGVGRELYARRKDGQRIPVEIGLNPLKVDGETFVVASILDISLRRQAEQRMLLVMSELTHRSKNLLAVIQAIARQAAASSPNFDAFHRDFGQRLCGLAQSDDLLVAGRGRARRSATWCTPGLRFRDEPTKVVSRKSANPCS
jgi:PAS domain-containing protein